MICVVEGFVIIYTGKKHATLEIFFSSHLLDINLKFLTLILTVNWQFEKIFFVYLAFFYNFTERAKKKPLFAWPPDRGTDNPWTGQSESKKSDGVFYVTIYQKNWEKFLKKQIGSCWKKN